MKNLNLLSLIVLFSLIAGNVIGGNRSEKNTPSRVIQENAELIAPTEGHEKKEQEKILPLANETSKRFDGHLIAIVFMLGVSVAVIMLYAKLMRMSRILSKLTDSDVPKQPTMIALNQSSDNSNKGNNVDYHENEVTLGNGPVFKTEISSNQLTNYERKWLKKLSDVMQSGIDKSLFNQEQLADEMAISKRQLQRLVKKYTGMSINAYYNQLKMKRAYELINSGNYRNVNEISRRVGFRSSNHFSKIFQSCFGQSPLYVMQNAA